MLGKLRRAFAGLLAAGFALFGSVQALGYEADAVQAGLSMPQTLFIASPAANRTTAEQSYYLTGGSDPSQPLLLNGDTVPDRGVYGSWGVNVPLYMGENTFTVTQTGSTDSVTITRVQALAPAVTNMLTNLYPQQDSAYREGAPLTFSCSGPSGAQVWAMLGELRVELTQTKDAAAGDLVKFSGKTYVGGVSAAHRYGPVTYGLRLDGADKTFTSAGALLLYPTFGIIPVRITDTAAAVYKESDGKAIAAVVKGGALDWVADQTDDMLLLGMGGWLPKTAGTLLLEGDIINTVEKTEFSRSSYGERIKLTGTVSPISHSWQKDGKLFVKLYNTTGIEDIPLTDSKLFSAVAVTEEEDGTVLEFTVKAGQVLWGHTLDYEGNVTTLYCKYPPVKTGGEGKPLQNIIVGLDPGHGGTDPGAMGVLGGRGPTEADITYATTLAVQQRLEALGATVLLTTRRPEDKSSFTDRMQASMDGKADFYISLHCNSVAGDGLRARGTEVYYFYDRAKPLAQAMQTGIAYATERTDRGIKNNSFRVTMNTLTPAVLVELGFVSHPQEYDLLCDSETIRRTANAIGDSLLALLGDV